MREVIKLPEKSLLKKTLDEIVKEGAQQILQKALEIEIEEFIQKYSHLTDESGKKRIVRNGHHNERIFQTKAGNVNIKVPRSRDRANDSNHIYHQSGLIPPYLRRTKDIDEFIPFLYLKGISTGDFSEVLTELLGEDVSMSSATVVKLKESWRTEYNDWHKRDLANKKYVYWWADGIYFNVRLEDDRACILLLMGVTDEGKKELIAIEDGHRESEISWRNILLDLKKRGLKKGPSVFKLVQSAEKRWQKIHNYNKISLVLSGEKFVNGVQ